MSESTERDLKGKVAIVTGANTGIGLVTARELAVRGAHVILACRNEEKARPVIDEIKALAGHDDVELLQLDLASLASVRRAAEAFLARDLPLHLLVNNAGMAGRGGLSEDGFELLFAVNHLGHHLFTRLLQERLVASAPARVINVSSRAHYSPKEIDWEALRKPTGSATGLNEYGVSKLANVLFTKELARRLEGTGVITVALHPGVIASDIWRQIPWPLRPLVTFFMRGVEEGAQTSLHCATAPDVESGLYYDECKPKKPSRPARDEALARELWDRSEAWVGLAEQAADEAAEA